MSDTVEKIATTVPSIYYDLIARVIPGASTVAAYMWTRSLRVSNAATATGLDGVALAACALVVSYVVGLLLTPLGSSICEGPVLLMSWLGLKLPLAKKSSRQLWKQIAEVEAIVPAAGATLAKMSAEVTLCQNLLAGAVIVWLISWKIVPVAVGLGSVLLCVVNVAFRTFVLFRRVDAFVTLPPHAPGPTGSQHALAP